MSTKPYPPTIPQSLNADNMFVRVMNSEVSKNESVITKSISFSDKGAAVQAISPTTPVPILKSIGMVTTVSVTTGASTASAPFTLTGAVIKADSTFFVTSMTASASVSITAVAAGVATVVFTNTSATPFASVVKFSYVIV